MTILFALDQHLVLDLYMLCTHGNHLHDEVDLVWGGELFNQLNDVRVSRPAEYRDFVVDFVFPSLALLGVNDFQCERHLSSSEAARFVEENIKISLLRQDTVPHKIRY